MKQLAYTLALTSAFALAVPLSPASASIETEEARATAMSAAQLAQADLMEEFGKTKLKPGQYVWKDGAPGGQPRVVISLSDQQAYLYRGNELVAAAAVSTGKPSKATPTGIFEVLQKKKMHHSRKYDNAPMPFMQRIDQYGIALHAGHNPGRPASHGCIRLPSKFAAKLYQITDLGTTVLIGA